MSKRKVIYRITCPNLNVYIGKAPTDTPTYCGSVNSEVVAEDFDQKELDDFTIRKEIIWSSQTASDSEVNAAEVEMIREFGSNKPGNRIQPLAESKIIRFDYVDARFLVCLRR